MARKPTETAQPAKQPPNQPNVSRDELLKYYSEMRLFRR